MGRVGGLPPLVRAETLAIEVVEHERLVISWVNDPLHTTVAWRLVPEGKATRLLLEHAGFTPDQTMPVEGMGEGWREAIGEKLPEVLATA